MIGRLRELRNDQLSGLVLFALALFAGWQNRVYPLGTLQEPGPGYTPLIVSIFLGAMGLLVALCGGASQRLADTAWSEGKRAATILIACGVATYALEAVGYIITVTALLVFFLGVLERRKPVWVAAVALSFSLLSYYLIAVLLRVPLPQAPWAG